MDDAVDGVAHLADGLAALQETTGNAPHAQALLTLISSRAHALIELAQTIVDSPIV